MPKAQEIRPKWEVLDENDYIDGLNMYNGLSQQIGRIYEHRKRCTSTKRKKEVPKERAETNHNKHS